VLPHIILLSRNSARRVGRLAASRAGALPPPTFGLPAVTRSGTNTGAAPGQGTCANLWSPRLIVDTSASTLRTAPHPLEVSTPNCRRHRAVADAGCFLSFFRGTQEPDSGPETLSDEQPAMASRVSSRKRTLIWTGSVVLEVVASPKYVSLQSLARRARHGCSVPARDSCSAASSVDGLLETPGAKTLSQPPPSGYPWNVLAPTEAKTPRIPLYQLSQLRHQARSTINVSALGGDRLHSLYGQMDRRLASIRSPTFG
jgi:hypothetical protein